MLYNDCWVYLVHDKVVGFLLVSDTEKSDALYRPQLPETGIWYPVVSPDASHLIKEKIHQIEIQSTQTALSYYQRCGFHLHSAESEEEACLLYKYVF